MKICTTIEQGERLIQAGIDPGTADLWWNYYSIIYNGTPLEVRLDDPWVGSFSWFGRPDNKPAWSLNALLGMVPRGGRLLKSATGTGEYSFDCPGGNNDSSWWPDPVDALTEWIISNQE